MKRVTAEFFYKFMKILEIMTARIGMIGVLNIGAQSGILMVMSKT